jgi:biotin synthase
MIGIGPYIPHPSTPLGSGALRPEIAPSRQVPNTEEMVYKMIALARIVRPDANIPSTSALATINKIDGRKQGLKVGANVVMPNLTPQRYRSLYQIYPAKACIDESVNDCNQCLRGQIRSLGRFAGRGPGPRGEIEARVEISPDSHSPWVQLQT